METFIGILAIVLGVVGIIGSIVPGICAWQMEYSLWIGTFILAGLY